MMTDLEIKEEAKKHYPNAELIETEPQKFKRKAFERGAKFVKDHYEKEQMKKEIQLRDLTIDYENLEIDYKALKKELAEKDARIKELTDETWKLGTQIEELKTQNEKMKMCANCKYLSRDFRGDFWCRLHYGEEKTDFYSGCHFWELKV